MVIWHLTPDAPRFPFFVSAGQHVNLQFGSWPIEGGQRTWIEYQVLHQDGTVHTGQVESTWNVNREANSYWFLNVGPFADGDRVEYRLRGSSPAGSCDGEPFSFVVSPKLHLAILWHQHQPLYKDLHAKRPQGSYRFPWVRLHAIRDYYAMAALLEQHPEVHLTINLTPVLLQQLEDYTERGATDRALELTLTPAARLSAAQREELLATFFEADWHTQIFPWPRYRALFEQRQDGRSFTVQDLADLQMWFNVAWFGPEFQEGAVTLPSGVVASALSYIAQGSGYSSDQIAQMVLEQLTIMRNVVAIHRRLQDRGQIEVSTTPFYHPILPLLADTDQATIDRDGATHPTRFHRPEDATAQVHQAVTFYQERFGHLPAGMWPAEGAVGQSVISLFAEAGMQWIATDRGVLERSGQYGYNVQDPNVLCQAYRAEDETGRGVAVFFRDPVLSDKIGFHYQHYADAGQAAADFVRELKERFAWRVDDPENRIVSIILDGENAWGAYRQQARPFLHALYAALVADPEIRTVTFREYLEGNPARGVLGHPVAGLRKVYDLFEASWIDENGSRPGNDLGTWIGEKEENQAWNLLRETRDLLDRVKATPERHRKAFDALYAAEGSDWFWWFGEDQASDSDVEFDDLFRTHLQNVYRSLRRRPPAVLTRPIVPHAPIWTFSRPIRSIWAGDRLIIRTNCPGRLAWKTNAQETWTEAIMVPAGGVMAAVHRFGLALGPFAPSVRWVEFRFRCTHAACCGTDACCRSEFQRVEILTDESKPLPSSRMRKRSPSVRSNRNRKT
ncbi:MAG: glycoside hydrolase family 57 protein [Nitrospira sp.]|nr:glycoside hydrolase family 57 protein [Nitrospira sp.]